MRYLDHADIAGIAAGIAAGVPAAVVAVVGTAAELDATQLLGLVGSGGGVAILALAVLLAREVRAAIQSLQTWRPLVRVQLVEDQEVTGIRRITPPPPEPEPPR